MRKIIIFDMDGTLIDSSIDITSSVNFVRNHFGLPAMSKTYIVDAINSKREELAFKLYGIEKYTHEHREIFEEHYKSECTKNTFLYSGILDVLQIFKEKGFLMSVATNAPTKFGEMMLGHLNILQYFDNVVGACKVEKPKPFPDMIHYILSKYGCEKNSYNTSECNPILVGDNHTDIEAAENAGIDFIFAKWGFGKDHSSNTLNYAHLPLDLLNMIQ